MLLITFVRAMNAISVSVKTCCHFSGFSSFVAYMVGQKSKPAYFCKNFVYCQPVFIILAHCALQEICNPRIVSPPNAAACCLSNALHSSIGQITKSVENGVRSPVSGNNHITTLSFLIGLFLSVCLSVCSKTAEGANFKFGRRVLRDSPHMP